MGPREERQFPLDPVFRREAAPRPVGTYRQGRPGGHGRLSGTWQRLPADPVGEVDGGEPEFLADPYFRPQISPSRIWSRQSSRGCAPAPSAILRRSATRRQQGGRCALPASSPTRRWLLSACPTPLAWRALPKSPSSPSRWLPPINSPAASAAPNYASWPISAAAPATSRSCASGPGAGGRLDMETLGTSGVGVAGDRLDYRIIEKIICPKLGLGSNYVSMGKRLPMPVALLFALPALERPVLPARPRNPARAPQSQAHVRGSRGAGPADLHHRGGAGLRSLPRGVGGQGGLVLQRDRPARIQAWAGADR